MPHLSKRLLALIDTLPLKENLRILEIGCGTGAAAREIVDRYNKVFFLGVDRSQKAIAQCMKGSETQIAAGKLKFKTVEIEEFKPEKSEALFDFAFAIRVGALDGRHPELEKIAKERIRKALKPKGKLFIDEGDTMIEIKIY